MAVFSHMARREGKNLAPHNFIDSCAKQGSDGMEPEIDDWKQCLIKASKKGLTTLCLREGHWQHWNCFLDIFLQGIMINIKSTMVRSMLFAWQWKENKEIIFSWEVKPIFYHREAWNNLLARACGCVLASMATAFAGCAVANCCCCVAETEGKRVVNNCCLWVPGTAAACCGNLKWQPGKCYGQWKGAT